MKNETPRRRLTLRREHLRQLTDERLREVLGGVTCSCETTGTSLSVAEDVPCLAETPKQ